MDSTIKFGLNQSIYIVYLAIMIVLTGCADSGDGAAPSSGSAESTQNDSAQSENALSATDAPPIGNTPTTLTDETKLSYVIGIQIGQNIKEVAGLDLNMLAMGIRDTYQDLEPKLGVDEQFSVLEAFRKQQAAEFKASQEKVGEENLIAGRAFLKENAAKEGVITTDTGLQYRVIEAGSGQQPKNDDRVQVHYTGTLIDGTVFDSSRERGVPATFGVNEVIPGWTEALQLMKVGAKWELVIPSDLAYGTRGSGRFIGANATLIFTVELIKVI